MKRLCLMLLTLVFFVSPSVVSAAAPDGVGPWADTVVSSSQGLRKDGSAVSAARSNPAAALGVAENNTVDTNFFSLGFGGVITLGFDNGISGGTLLVEATNAGYPVETAKVEVSPNGTTWTLAGTVAQDGEVSLPESVPCAKYVRITDTSNPADFSDGTADAYDLDGVRSTGQSCEVPTPTPTPPCDPQDKECCAGNTTITQTNKTVVKTLVVAHANTGGNKVKKNTGGSANITTGNASNSATVVVGGSSNTAVAPCCGGGSTNVTIANNGAGSTNTVKIKNTKLKPPVVD